MVSTAAEAKQAADANGQAFKALTGQLQQLTARLDSTLPPAAPVPAVPPAVPTDGPEPCVGTLECFAGDPATCGALIMNCSLFFSLQPSTFATEAAKVAFTITHLTDRACLWGTEQFGQGISRPAAAGTLLAFRQGQRSVMDYAVEFRTVGSWSGWPAASPSREPGGLSRQEKRRPILWTWSL